MKAWPALISGMLFGLGLKLSGMPDPAKVQGFLNITGDWVPDLIFVMGGAVVVTVWCDAPWRDGGRVFACSGSGNSVDRTIGRCSGGCGLPHCRLMVF